MRRIVRCVLLGTLLSTGAKASSRDLAAWTPREARGACAALANLAVRRASIARIVYTRPATFRQGTWTLRGVLRLTQAPGGLNRAPFTCVFTQASDLFEVKPVSLTLGS
ncbi:hypothetical protein [Deinococcus budaensis]|uniref:Uncharacterized protein n=1 Tax=Deinococcus budaensis TaxID=1665626 RepID=A0A7W8GCS8_9DEIO|nr:hypothetical protein [Deinococcus budaensis]MBB5233215.1 hypothetical protein [Deinococcus budaensis]